MGYAFGILDEVAQGSHTKWKIVYDLKNKMIYFKSLGFLHVKNISFSAFDFSCTAKAKVFEINQAGKGDISPLFTDFSIDINQRVVEKSFEESSSQVPSSGEGRKAAWEYPRSLECLQNSRLRVSPATNN